ncbi:helix-turn-helix domain-containing protein (plasmid) [Weissella paramesenteroides]|uniref:helix-turn-helix domain-containing protein n=1 Tax=Lactobacillaceae TaxID=33958 RepID=UPI0002192E17|nr:MULTISPECIES: helix-turn-helix transcriptional regulator [Lactobacillaceae]APU66117.1 HTH-type transcriptional regulator ImmR [Weissella cibaria]MCG4286533.1 helix-turn-helix domain-containing protein [Weissella cibaria]MCT8388479.1 XRE family transcriptional regulator [Leuconostoc lactis]PAV31699.1 XRE family transcriptional regulator [Leuconostoc lactis]UJF03257.1 helix-turn-helix domain-containing protein [Weissella cibaria]
MILGQRIKEEREKRQWTQDYLAETLNVSRQTISKWEVGSTYPDIDRLVQISNLFGITLDSLIKGDDSLKKSIVITKNAKAQTNVWEFMRSTGWMMVIAIIYLVTKMIIAVFS